MSDCAEVFHAGEFICDELVKRGWTTSHVVGAAGGTPLDVLALDLYLCCPDRSVRIGDLADILARGFGVSGELFRNLERAWLQSPHAQRDFDPPASVFAGAQS